MKIIRFIFSLILAFLSIGIVYWLLSLLFPWFIGLSGFWFYFLLSVFSYITYHFFFTNFQLFAQRKTIILFLGNSPINWIRAVLLIFYSIFGSVVVLNSYILKTDHSTWEFIAYWVFVMLIIQFTINMIFTYLSKGDK